MHEKLREMDINVKQIFDEESIEKTEFLQWMYNETLKNLKYGHFISY